MFSGIITHLGRVVAVETTESGVRLTTASAMFAAGADPLRLGESIAHSGVCLTVVAFGGGEASFDIGSETLRCTTLGDFAQVTRLIWSAASALEIESTDILFRGMSSRSEPYSLLRRKVRLPSL